MVMLKKMDQNMDNELYCMIRGYHADGLPMILYEIFHTVE